MTKRNVIIIGVIVLAAVFLGFHVSIIKSNKTTNSEVFTTGLAKGQSDYFGQQLKKTGVQYRYIQKGNHYLKNGNIEAAIKMFETAQENAYSQATRGVAIINLANAYEKKRDYRKALEYTILSRDKYANDWAKAPYIERAKYLEYASTGNYKLAIKYAELTIKAETEVHNSKTPSEGYVERLNDLKASKAYIESLKKN